MVAVMIGVDPHKGSHTAVAIGVAEEVLGELRVRACTAQAQRLLGWAAAWPDRTWAVEGAGGLGHLLAQQLLAAGSHPEHRLFGQATPGPATTLRPSQRPTRGRRPAPRKRPPATLDAKRLSFGTAGSGWASRALRWA